VGERQEELQRARLPFVDDGPVGGDGQLGIKYLRSCGGDCW
jgi:hypothetical protein